MAKKINKNAEVVLESILWDVELLFVVTEVLKEIEMQLLG
mgnify:CR=1 FL=1